MQEYLAPYGEESPEFLGELERTVALLAFDRPGESPFADLFSPSHRNATASELNAALLSRCQVLVLERLEAQDLEELLARAEASEDRPLPVEPQAREVLCALADGDGRQDRQTRQGVTGRLAGEEFLGGTSGQRNHQNDGTSGGCDVRDLLLESEGKPSQPRHQQKDSAQQREEKLAFKPLGALFIPGSFLCGSLCARFKLRREHVGVAHARRLQ